MLVPEIALRFRSDEGDGEPVVVATTSAPPVVRLVANELVREAEAAAEGVAGADPVLGQLLDAEVQRLRVVYAAVAAEPGEMRLVTAPEESCVPRPLTLGRRRAARARSKARRQGEP